ncbi:MAG: hypothetical protein ACT4ON_11635 [Bacteroidota bacterium]
MLLNKKSFLLSIAYCVLPVFLHAQEGTRIAAKDTITAGKILLIPFEPKMYMSDMDAKINQQTKWKSAQINENFRHQLDSQLKLKLQSTRRVVSFYSDSVKMSKDLMYIYNSTSLSYDLADKPTSATIPSERQSGIKNGELKVEMNMDKKFMNTKLTGVEMLSYLSKKYKTDYFVFVNELDIKIDPETYDISTDSYQREVTVHYSILDKTGKTISAGISTSRISSKINEPKKIVSLTFSPIATYIAAKFSALVNPPAQKK